MRLTVCGGHPGLMKNPGSHSVLRADRLGPPSAGGLRPSADLDSPQGLNMSGLRFRLSRFAIPAADRPAYPSNALPVVPQYWLMKSEPDEASIDDLAACAAQARWPWTGVRNYQARNFMRDAMQPGDGVLLLPLVLRRARHRRPGEASRAGTAPDTTQFDARRAPTSTPSPRADAAALAANRRASSMRKTRLLAPGARCASGALELASMLCAASAATACRSRR